MRGDKLKFQLCVAEQGIAPCLGDYEPPVQLYTTPLCVL